MVENKKMWAVLTGDLVKSSKLTNEQLSNARKCLAEAANDLDGLIGEPVLEGDIDFFRGDGWQLLLKEPKSALRACLFLRGRLLARAKVDTRIAVGIGGVSHIEQGHVSTSIGQAFELSGALLDKLKARRRMSCSRAINDEINAYTASIYELCDALIQKWTAAQAEVVTWALRGLTQNEIGDNISPNITSQTVGKQLISVGWYALEPVLERVENQVQ